MTTDDNLKAKVLGVLTVEWQKKTEIARQLGVKVLSQSHHICLRWLESEGVIEVREIEGQKAHLPPPKQYRLKQSEAVPMKAVRARIQPRLQTPYDDPAVDDVTYTPIEE